MRNLFVFGCSFTQPYFDDLNADLSEGGFSKYKRWKGGVFPKTWSELLADKLDYTLKNYGRGGSCNYYNIRQYNDRCHEIQEGDLVIFEWTHVERFWVAMDDGRVLTSVAGNWQFDNVGLSPETVEEVYVNRSCKAFAEEIYSFQNGMDQMAKLGKYEIFYWSACDLIINSESNDFKSDRKYLLTECDESAISYYARKHDNLRINQETNNEVTDQHYGEYGHKFLCDKIYDELKDKGAI
jgi:hypothetical protein